MCCSDLLLWEVTAGPYCCHHCTHSQKPESEHGRAINAAHSVLPLTTQVSLSLPTGAGSQCHLRFFLPILLPSPGLEVLPAFPGTAPCPSQVLPHRSFWHVQSCLDIYILADIRYHTGLLQHLIMTWLAG